MVDDRWVITTSKGGRTHAVGLGLTTFSRHVQEERLAEKRLALRRRTPGHVQQVVDLFLRPDDSEEAAAFIDAYDAEWSGMRREELEASQVGLSLEVSPASRRVVGLAFRRVGDDDRTYWNGTLPFGLDWSLTPEQVLATHPAPAGLPEAPSDDVVQTVVGEHLLRVRGGPEGLSLVELSLRPDLQATFDTQEHAFAEEMAKIAAPELGTECLEGDCILGTGKARMKGGAVYEGDMVVLVPHGHGTLHSEGGVEFEGGWARGEPSPWLEIRWPDGRVWRGPVEDYHPHGQGRLTFTIEDRGRFDLRGRMAYGVPKGVWEGTLNGDFVDGVWRDGVFKY